MRYLLSGATGYVGKHVLARLLADGHAVTVLVRPRQGRCHARIVACLHPFDIAPSGGALPAIEVMQADLLAGRCGIGDDTLAALRASAFDAFIHCAGLTRFDEHLADEIMRNNLDGTRHAYDLAVAAGIPRFHHVSTAFVAGNSGAAFGSENLDVGQAFHNPYERSKFAAEALLQERARRAGPAVTVYRPSIIVGGFPLAENHAATTVYTFIKALHFLRECCVRDGRRGRPSFARHGVSLRADGAHIPLRIAAADGATINLVAIEDVVDAILRGLRAPSKPLGTLTIVGPDLPLAGLRDAICGALAVSGPAFVAPEVFLAAPRTSLEEHFRRITRAYEPYLLGSPAFVADPGPPPRALDMEAVTRSFIEQLGGRRARGASGGVGALALAVAGVREPRDYLRGLVEGEVGRHFLARHAYVDACVRFRIRGEYAVDQTLAFRRGRATRIEPTEHAAAHCTYTLDDELFMRIVSGRTDLRSAFFAGKVGIEGDKELALKFGALLGMYYHRIDEHIIEEVTA